MNDSRDNHQRWKDREIRQHGLTVARRSPLTGKINFKFLPVTHAQLNELESPHPHRKVQEIFPTLSAEDREFLLTGYTQEDWDKMFPKEEE